MEGRCKKCGKEERVKNVYVKGKQRYKCKGCGQSYRAGDLRERDSTEKLNDIAKLLI